MAMPTIWTLRTSSAAVPTTVSLLRPDCNSMHHALGQIAGSPVLGWIGTAFSLRAALTAGTFVYTLVLPLLRQAGNQVNED